MWRPSPLRLYAGPDETVIWDSLQGDDAPCCQQCRLEYCHQATQPQEEQKGAARQTQVV